MGSRRAHRPRRRYSDQPPSRHRITFNIFKPYLVNIYNMRHNYCALDKLNRPPGNVMRKHKLGQILWRQLGPPLYYEVSPAVEIL